MKKLLTFVLAAALCLALAIPAMAQNVTAPRVAEGSIIIDGVKDAGYSSASYTVRALQEADMPATCATAEVWTAWDGKNIYYYIEVVDRTPNAGTGAPDAQFDMIELYIDWENGKGGSAARNAEGDWEWEIASPTPYWQIRVPSQKDIDGYLEAFGLILEGEGFAGIEWSPYFEEELGVELVTAPLNGSWNNGYIVEIKIPAPVALREGMSIPIDFSVLDTMYGEGVTDGRRWLNPSQFNDTQWCVPNSCTGLLTLGGAGGAGGAETANTDAGTGGGSTANTNTGGGSARTNDNFLVIVVLGIAALGAVIVTRRILKNKA